jgi:hypothetical protein
MGAQVPKWRELLSLAGRQEPLEVVTHAIPFDFPFRPCRRGPFPGRKLRGRLQSRGPAHGQYTAQRYPELQERCPAESPDCLSCPRIVHVFLGDAGGLGGVGFGLVGGIGGRGRGSGSGDGYGPRAIVCPGAWVSCLSLIAEPGAIEVSGQGL